MAYTKNTRKALSTIEDARISSGGGGGTGADVQLGQIMLKDGVQKFVPYTFSGTTPAEGTAETFQNLYTYNTVNPVPSGGGGTTSFYKCASVNTSNNTWTGYKAIWNSSLSKYQFESSLTTDTLTFTVNTPVIGKVYSADALIEANLWKGIPTAGLVFHASLNNGAIETGNTMAVLYGTRSYQTVDGVSCMECDEFASNISGKSSLPYGTNPRTFSVWFKSNEKSTSHSCNLVHTGTKDSAAFTVIIRQTGKLDINNWNDYGLNSTKSVCDETWHHICTTYENGVIKLYIDGILDISDEHVFNTVENAFSIGFNAYDFGRINGYIAGYRIYNRALSASEIASLATEYTPTTNA